MTQKLTLNFFLIILVAPFLLQAQDAQFSQFYSSPVLISPSFAGITGGGRMSLNYRDQWSGLVDEGKAYVTYAMAVDNYFEKMNSGVGFYILQDKAGAGEYGELKFNLMYSYDFKIDRNWHVRPGLAFSYSQLGVNFDDLTFGDQVTLNGIKPNTVEQPVFPDRRYLDAATSVLIYSSKYWGGLTVDHLFLPEYSLSGSDSRLPLTYSLYGGMKARATKSKRQRPGDPNVTFTFLYKRKGDANQLDLGAYYEKEPFVIGTWLRGIPLYNQETGWSGFDDIVVLLGYKIKEFTVGYSYDFSVSELLNLSGGSHELAVNIKFNQPKFKYTGKKGQVPCPDF